jgi:hypothetical protein
MNASNNIHAVGLMGEEVKFVCKVKLSLCLTKHYAMKTYWGVEVYLHEFFDLGTRRR